MNMPTLAELRAQLHHAFTLADASGRTVRCELSGVHEGSAMNARYVCYSASFALPSEVGLPQAVYAVCALDDGAPEWPLLLTPVLPGDDGRARMEAVFHVPSQTQVSGSKPEVAAKREPVGSQLN